MDSATRRLTFLPPMPPDDPARNALGGALADILAGVVRDEVRQAMRELQAHLTAAPAAAPAYDPEQLLRVEEVAALLQVKPATVRTWIRAGHLHGVLLGPAGTRREYRVRRAALTEFVAQGAIQPVVDIDAAADRILCKARSGGRKG
jgi:excisionase family DNA binding protein